MGFYNTYAIKKDGSLWFGDNKGFIKMLDDVLLVNSESEETVAIKKIKVFGIGENLFLLRMVIIKEI